MTYPPPTPPAIPWLAIEREIGTLAARMISNTNADPDRPDSGAFQIHAARIGALKDAFLVLYALSGNNGDAFTRWNEALDAGARRLEETPA